MLAAVINIPRADHRVAHAFFANRNAVDLVDFEYADAVIGLPRIERDVPDSAAHELAYDSFSAFCCCHCCWCGLVGFRDAVRRFGPCDGASSGGWVAYALRQVVHKYDADPGGLLERLDKAADAGACFANIDPVLGGIAAPEGALDDLVTIAYALVREVPMVAAVRGLQEQVIGWRESVLEGQHM